MSAGTAMSAVVWMQPPLFGTGITNVDITQYAVANDFELAASGSLTGFTVFLADRAQSSLLDGVMDNFSGTLGWALFANAGSAPGALLFSGDDTSPDILSSGMLVGTREMFQVDGDFGSAIDLEPGVYWLSIRDGKWGSASDGTVVGWVPGTQIELSSGVYEEDPQNPDAWTTAGVDLALTIHGEVVPEPSSMMLLASAFAMMLHRRNRR